MADAFEEYDEYDDDWDYCPDCGAEYCDCDGCNCLGSYCTCDEEYD